MQNRGAGAGELGRAVRTGQAKGLSTPRCNRSAAFYLPFHLLTGRRGAMLPPRLGGSSATRPGDQQLMNFPQRTGFAALVKKARLPCALAALCIFGTRSEAQLSPGLLRQIYTNIAGSTIADLTGSPKFPLAPDIVDTVSTLESQWLPDSAGEDYGQRLTGWLVPPLSGDYVFYLASDDASQVFLSTDDTVAHKQLIVEEPSWSPAQNWEGTADNPQRASASIPLEAGKFYYLEVLHKEGWGGDQVAVAWKLPGGPAPRNGDPPIGES